MGQHKLYIILNSSIKMSNFSQKSTLAVKRGKKLCEVGQSFYYSTYVTLRMISEFRLRFYFLKIYWENNKRDKMIS